MQPIELTRADGTTVALTPLTTNALVSFEESLGKPFGALLPELGAFGFDKVSLATIRAFLKVAIVSHDYTLDEVGQVMDEVGIDAIAATVNRALIVTADKPAPVRKRKGRT